MPQALTGIRVLDFGQYVAGPLAALLLADQGADVVRIDPPGGPKLDIPANAYWNRGKRSIVLNLKQARDVEIARGLIESADVVIENFRPGVMDRLGLGAAALCEANPRLIYCSLPGFASDDPRAAMPAWEGVVESAAGLYRRAEGPVFSALPVSSTYAAFLGAISVVMALQARERDGLGQRIEVPLFDASFTAIGNRAQHVHKLPEGYTPPWSGLPPWLGEKECKDGRHVFYQTNNTRVHDFINAAGASEWWDGTDAPQRITALFKTRTALEWEKAAEAIGTECVMCRTSAEWLREPHARASGMIAEVQDPKYGPMLQPGIQVQMSATPGAIRSPAPALDGNRDEILAEQRTTAAPATSSAPAAMPPPRAVLDGVKVLDLCIVLAGPTCGRTLAEFGADVIKINGPARANALSAPYDPAVPHGLHVEVNRGKRSLLLDLKTERGKEVFWRLLDGADVVLENYRHGVIERLGLGYDEVRRRRPDIVYASMNTYGYSGPWATRPGHEQLAQTATGISARYGGDGRPVLHDLAMDDYATGLMGAYAVALALLHRRKTGEGQHVSTGLAFTACALQSAYLNDYDGKVWDEPRGQSARGFGPLQRLYRASDEWFFLGARESDREALAAVEGLAGTAGLADADLEAQLEQRFAGAPASVWVERLAAAGLGAQALTDYPRLMADPWAKAHGLSLTREHDGYGLIDTIGPAPRLSRTPIVPGRPAPRYGTDAESILKEHGLGDEIDSLIADGTVLLDL